MMKLTLLLVIAQADIGVQHEGRVKPLDTFARQLMQFLSEKETFLGDPVEAILSLARRPEEGRSKRLIKITHPELKERFALDRALTHYSLADLEPARPRMAAEAAEIDEEEATSRERATLKVLHQYGMIEALSRERLLTIIPIPHGENHAWLTPTDVRAWLGGQSHPVIDEFVAQDPSRREALRDVVARWDGEQVAGLAERLRALNPKVYPAADRVQTELLYNRLRPFHKASALYFAAALGFLLAMVFQSRKTGWVAMGVHGLGLGLTLYGYALRWTIAGRYPLSNHYESMVMCALGAALFVPILEAWVKAKGVAGMSGALVASVLLVLANNVPAFAEQGFVAPLVPALQTVWMTIHVPVIMVGYAMGMLLMVLGHVALGQSFRAAGPSAHLDAILYRVLQLTALFLLVGIILGAVWAGEAWGRPWGWDMKETWALITLLCYLAILHARFLGAIRTFGTSVASLAAFQVMILTYYGVNFLFGKGLHTYGFGSGEVWPLAAFAALEMAFVMISVFMRVGRRPPAPEQA